MLKTELSERKKAVLAAVVKAYIETGEPIGSKILMGLLENAPSSATLRNEMNELCSLGYLTQPHTSAGRVPTSLGYRLYIESLMQPSVLQDNQKGYIDRYMLSNSASYEAMPQAAANLLSELTGFPAFSCFIADKDIAFKQIKLLNSGRRSAVLLAVTSDGRSLSCMCRLSGDLSQDTLAQFEKTTKEKLIRKPLSSFSKAYLQNLVMSLTAEDFGLMALFTELFKMAVEASESKTSLSGASRLYGICSGDNARRIVSLISNPDLFLSVLKREEQEDSIIFGNDTVFPELSGKAIAVTDYVCRGRKCGKIGIIGPSRMSYDNIIPNLEYAALVLGKLMTDAAKDMED